MTMDASKKMFQASKLRKNGLPTLIILENYHILSKNNWFKMNLSYYKISIDHIPLDNMMYQSLYHSLTSFSVIYNFSHNKAWPITRYV